jgi:hypothetical protein
MSSADTDDASDMLVRKYEFGFIEDLLDRIVATQASINEWFIRRGYANNNLFEKGRSGRRSTSGLPYSAVE